MKENRILHLQIQEGQLTKYGEITPTSTRWAPITKFTILDKGVREGHDYHLLQFDQREIDLDDLMAPVGHVVVGSTFIAYLCTQKMIFRTFLDGREILAIG